MDSMEHLFLKTRVAGIFGAITSGGGWLASEYLHGALGNILLMLFALSSMISLVSIFFLMAVNRHRNQIKAIEQARIEILLCRECREGFRPTRCPLPISDRPPNCPLNPNSQPQLKPN